MMMATSKVLGELRGIDLIELLEHDQRPTLVLDLKDPLHEDYERSRIVFCNAALRSYPTVFTSIYQGGNENWQSPEFKEWAFGFPNHDYLINGNLPTIFYHGLLWTCSTLKRRWRIISCSRNTGPNLTLTDLNQMPYDTPPKIVQSEKLNEGHGLKGKRRYPRWTDVLPSRPHMQLFKDTDWSATALGPLDQWPDLLRHVTRFLMSDSRFATVFWGPQMVTLYNEAFIEVATRKHPSIMGITVEIAWGEIAEYLKGSFATAEKDGQATNMVNSPLYLERYGYLEETFFSYTIIPVRDEDGITRGFYAAGFDTTREVIWQRRLSTLISVSATPDIDSYWYEVLKGFESNELDIPLAAIYSLQRDVDMQSLAPATTIQFRGGLGVAEGHPLAVKRSDLRQGSELVMPLFQKVMAIGGPLVLLVEDGSLPKGLLPGLNWRGFGPSTTVVILPLTAAEETLGFLLIGLNPRRPYDEDYQGFIKLLHRQLSTSLTSALLVDRARRKQAELVNELAASESRFKAMTELNTTGLFYLSANGELVYANDAWYDITGHPRTFNGELFFMSLVLDEDQAFVQGEWLKVTVLRIRSTFESRIRKKWYHKESDSWKFVWILVTVNQEQYEDGSLKSVMGSITDISLTKQAQEDASDRANLNEQLVHSQKEANEILVRSRIEAEEARKSMEKFMDITSHEMRNPLSAIIQSADGIATSLLEFQESPKSAVMSTQLVDSSMEAIQIITLCAQHQERIVNDVLTLSKLESGMFLISPTPIQPFVAVKQVLRMFDGELLAHGIDLEFFLETSYKRYGFDWVMVDFSRISQILVNLMTNAIKFTRPEAKRFIKVSIGGSTCKPYMENPDLDWFPSRRSDCKKDLTLDSEWGDGEPVFLIFTVQDTGRGLSIEEKARLFQRFTQASPRTHVKYGGSGLGLFISREITEFHGGEIGLSSEFGKGSTFAFYIKGRRGGPPTPPEGARQGMLRNLFPEASRLVPAIPTGLPGAKTIEVSDIEQATSAMKVLLVEDNLVNQRVLSRQLQRAGCIVHVANHGQEALDFLQDSDIWKGNVGGKCLDVVLMDLEMPIMDGLTCARRIRELQRSGSLIRHVPIIAVTANARKEQVQSTVAAGIDDFMPKPFRVPDLLPKMEKLRAPEQWR